MAETVEVKGLRELREALLQLPRKLDRPILNQALRAGARLMVLEARSRVAVLHGVVKKNIFARAIRPEPRMAATVIFAVRKLTVKQIIKRKAFNIKRGLARYASDPFYWRFLEFGTSKMAARPFMRPAFEAKKVAAVAAFSTVMGPRIEKEAVKLGLGVR